MRKILKAILWIVLAFFWIGAASAGGVAAGVYCTAIVLVICRSIWKRHLRKEAELSGGFASYEAGLPALSEKELTKICLIEELQRYTDPTTPVAKDTVLWRLIYTAIYSVVNIGVLVTGYATGRAIWTMSLLTLLYVWLMTTASTVSVLYRKAKNNPKMDFSELVQWEIRRNCPTKKLIGIGVGMFLLSLGIFFGTCSQEKWVFDKYEEGYMVEAYQPSAFCIGRVEIPEEHKGKPVVAIGEKAFEDMALIREIQLPKEIRSIGSGAFKGCKNLKEIDLPDGLVELQGEAFMDCWQLEAIKIPAGVTEIRGNTFDGCQNLEEVTLHDGITAIHAFAFRGCAALEEIDLPPLITEIREQTFAECKSLESIRIPKGVTRIAARAFYGCRNLKEVEIPDSVLEIRSSAFRECDDLKEIQLPGHTTVDEKAFKDSPTKIKRKSR